MKALQRPEYIQDKQKEIRRTEKLVKKVEIEEVLAPEYCVPVIIRDAMPSKFWQVIHDYNVPYESQDAVTIGIFNKKEDAIRCANLVAKDLFEKPGSYGDSTVYVLGWRQETIHPSYESWLEQRYK